MPYLRRKGKKFFINAEKESEGTNNQHVFLLSLITL